MIDTEGGALWERRIGVFGVVGVGIVNDAEILLEARGAAIVFEHEPSGGVQRMGERRKARIQPCGVVHDSHHDLRRTHEGTESPNALDDS